MFTLPRGVGTAIDVPLASAAWESPLAVEQLVYQGAGSLFVGAIPASENWPRLQELYGRATAAADEILQAAVPPLARSKAMKALTKNWRAALLADCVPLGLDDDRHFITIAGSRSGKGTSCIIPNLFIYPGSAICIDPKAEDATTCAARRAAAQVDGGLGQEVFVLDLVGNADVPDDLRAGFNALSLLDPRSPQAARDAGMIAVALVVPTDPRDAHWTESARNFLKGLILHLITTMEQPSLLTLRQFLTQGDRLGWEAALDACEDEEAAAAFLKRYPSAFSYLLGAMSDNPAFRGLIAGAAETLIACGDNERGSILSTARRDTAFLEAQDQHFIDTLEGRGRTFQPEIFKKARRGASLFLCVPGDEMSTYAGWLRLMVSVILKSAYRDQAPPACGAPLLFVLEEFHSLGHIDMIEKAAGYAAGFGVTLWVIIQDLQQISSLYPKSWQTFMANAGAIQVFGVSDPETTAYVSKTLGEVEVIRNVTNQSINSQHGQSAPSMHQKVGGVFNNRGLSPLRLALTALPDATRSESETMAQSVNEQIQIVPLLRPDEVATQFARESGAALLLIKGRRPMWTLRVNYFDHPWFAGRYGRLLGDGTTHAARPEFGERSPGRLREVAARFDRLSR